MTAPEPYGVRVTTTPPRRRDVVAPERDVVTGRYRAARDREDKHRRPERDQPSRTRRPSHARRVRPWHVAAGAGAAAVVVAGAIALAAGGDANEPAAVPTTASLAPSTTATPSEPSTTAVPPSSAVPTSVTPSTAPATTTTAALVPVDIATELAGEYAFAMTIVDGNSNFPLGTSQDVDVTFLADCAQPGCTVSSPQYADAAWTFDDDAFATTVVVSEACLTDPGVTVETTIDVVLSVSGREPDGLPTALSGSQTQATPGAAACPTTINDPITWSIEATRIA